MTQLSKKQSVQNVDVQMIGGSEEGRSNTGFKAEEKRWDDEIWIAKLSPVEAGDWIN